MTLWFGNPSQFAVAIGSSHQQNTTLRVFDVWVGGDCTSGDDNLAYVPQIQHSLVMEARSLPNRLNLGEPFPGLSLAEQHQRLETVDDGSAETFWFMHWGPTTDNCAAFVFRFGSDLVITCRNLDRPDSQRSSGRILEARVDEAELIQLLLDASAALTAP